jgi:hypothetical protein
VTTPPGAPDGSASIDDQLRTDGGTILITR